MPFEKVAVVGGVFAFTAFGRGGKGTGLHAGSGDGRVGFNRGIGTRYRSCFDAAGFAFRGENVQVARTAAPIKRTFSRPKRDQG